MSLGSDTIIHPRSQGTGNEAEFVETWAERKLRLAREREGRRTDLPRNAKGKSKQYDKDFERAFRRLYAAGMKYERIAIELGISNRAVGRYRKHYGLPFRVDNEAKPSAIRVKVNFDISEEMDRKITHHCSGRFHTRSQFFRSLLLERLG